MVYGKGQGSSNDAGQLTVSGHGASSDESC